MKCQVQSYVLKCILLVIDYCFLCFFLSLHVCICVGTKYTQADHVNFRFDTCTDYPYHKYAYRLNIILCQLQSRFKMKCKYRVRCFSSKGAFLVLLWTLLVGVHYGLLLHAVIGEFHLTHNPSAARYWSLSIPIILILFVSAPLSGWLADAKFGNYKVFLAGAVLLFISAVMFCLSIITKELIIESSHVPMILLCFAFCFLTVGTCACIVTALPLGLDQMPDASSSSISSYITWFAWSLLLGFFLDEILDLLEKKFLNLEINESYLRLFCALFSTICMSMVLVLNFAFSPKWLIIEPKSHQSLKTIYQVLKFAAKHKAPLDRSALTYWEEDIPSRIDTGKSKYGGPFSVEEVEDVKTILRLFVISLPIFFICLFLTFRIHKYGSLQAPSAANVSDMHSTSLAVITFSLLHHPLTYAIAVTFVFEFLVYPLVWYRLPSILKRIGTVPLTMSLVSFVSFFLMLAHLLSMSHSSGSTIELIAYILYNLFNGILSQVLLTALLEFMCAQSPYHMRGLLLSFVVPFTLVSYMIGWNVGSVVSQKVCSVSWCSLTLFSLKTITCFFGFFVFCVVARWYKMRVRDEDYSPQRVVEEVYDRYLTAAAAQSKLYGARN